MKLIRNDNVKTILAIQYSIFSMFVGEEGCQMF